ncbi:Processive diacylglycerol beta-glucosyltransferase [Clostridium liquoris]|jgi:processive 1,2-diacylglycerol beta-glucosyltransferase|uniref:Processive diacylglycerol beta-glucosyltransferase n=1 Tax=Clostridium liquoris TaxID=1289519 RepID=A0A2T0B932_9CLOT|nr:glycosyltransferase [Clostridium liquoris]PRR80409.1 Processive diacylglycerol beta-glucosyltransferase [Clostridium liquoris]
MRALIFSVSAGGGHSRAAEAIKDYIYLYDPDSEVKIIDTLKYINPIIDKVIIGSYLKTIKVTPSLFGKLYDYSETDFGLATISSKINEILTYRLLPLINDFEPDILIATHPFPTEMLSILKIKHKTELPTMSILTDYAPHSFWLHPCIDAYIVSNADMIPEMISKGIPKNTIFDIGIPIDPKFLTEYDRKETLAEIQFSTDKTTILIMGGSLGMGKIEYIYEELLGLENDIQIIVITGNNKKLYYELMKYQNISTKGKKTYIIGFTDKVNKYMQASDLLLTKPGGLTITEALICKIPIGVFSPIPGQEEKNTEFLVKHNLAVDLSHGNSTKETIENLLSDPNNLLAMKENCSKFSKPFVGRDIYNLILKLIKTNQA